MDERSEVTASPKTAGPEVYRLRLWAVGFLVRCGRPLGHVCSLAGVVLQLAGCTQIQFRQRGVAALRQHREGRVRQSGRQQ